MFGKSKPIEIKSVDELALMLPYVYLSRPVDFDHLVAHHFSPVRDPSC